MAESPIGLSLGWYEAVYILGIETAIKLEQNQCYAALKSLPGWYWYQFGTASGHISPVGSSVPVLVPLLTPGGAGLHARPQATYQTLVEQTDK